MIFLKASLIAVQQLTRGTRRPASDSPITIVSNSTFANIEHNGALAEPIAHSTGPRS